MGCDVGCPYIGKAFDDNWNLPDLFTDSFGISFFTINSDVVNRPFFVVKQIKNTKYSDVSQIT